MKLVGKKSTAKHYLALAAAVWRWAVERDIIQGAWPDVGRRNRIKADETAKRPYTDSEVRRILDWIDEAAPAWSAVFHLLADTGQRVGAILGLQGKDVIEEDGPTRVHFQRQWVGGQIGSWRKLKTKKSVVTPLPPDTARRLPRVGPNDLLFPNAKDRERPARIESIRDNLHKAIAATGIADPENLDTHSLRRAWVATAKRNGVADAIGMKITGHSQESIYDGYGRNVVGDDLVQAVEAVHAARTRARETPAKRDLPRLSHGLVAEPLDPKDLAGSYDLTSYAPDQGLAPEAAGRCGVGAGDTGAVLTWLDVARRAGERGTPEHLVARVARWADEDPVAMSRLIADEVLLGELLRALRALGVLPP